MENNLVKIIAGDGNHYSINKAIDSMGLLRAVFPDGKADTMSFCLFSTSGIHGSYKTIEEYETENDESGITFIIVQPRMVRLQYGVVSPESYDDIEFLKKIRESSKDAIKLIG